MKRLILLVVFLCFTSPGYADNCQINETLFGTVSLGNSVIQRDAPIGSEIARARLSGYALLQVNAPDGPATCNGGYAFTYLSATPSAINHVYNTNLEGVGIRLSVTPGNFVLPSNGSAYIYSLGYYDVFLIKTGKITPGYLTPGILMQGWFVSPDNNFTRISLDANSQVTVLACSLASQTINFSLGDINASEFTTQPGFIPARSDTQNLGLNCDPGANINVELTGAQNPDTPADSSVLALNGQGSAGTAEGVGIQLLYNNTPLQLNKRMVLKNAAGGQETFPLVARYYQTRSVVKPGSANATATLNITYQ